MILHSVVIGIFCSNDTVRDKPEIHTFHGLNENDAWHEAARFVRSLIESHVENLKEESVVLEEDECVDLLSLLRQARDNEIGDFRLVTAFQRFCEDVDIGETIFWSHQVSNLRGVKLALEDQ